MPDPAEQPPTGSSSAPAPSSSSSSSAGAGPEGGDRPVEQAGIVVGHRSDDEPIITDRDPDPSRQEPTPTDSGSASEE